MPEPRGELPGRVLVLDDEPLVLRAWQRWCENCGIAITTASTPDQVRAVLEREPPFDLLLCDFHLKACGEGVTSAALVRELCAAGQPAVVVTGDATRADMMLGGAAPIVSKRADFGAVLVAAWDAL